MIHRLHLLSLLESTILVLTLVACSITPADQVTAPPTEAHTLTLTTPDEPGQPLTIYGRVIDDSTDKPVPGARIYLYHADADGEYEPADPSDESTARLSGEVVSGESGQFTLHTIVPREYDIPGNRHIHIHYVQVEGFRDFGGVVLFEDDVNDEMRLWAQDTGFGLIIPLQESQGEVEGKLTIALTPE